MTKQTLYEKNTVDWAAIGVYWPRLAEMACYFTDRPSMERALGYGPSVISKWVAKRGGISREAERRADVWLDNYGTAAEPKRALETPYPAAGTASMFLIVCPAGSEAKVQRVLALMGCEVTDV